MRIDVDTCRDPDLLAGEVRRLQAVIAAGEPALTEQERLVLTEVRDIYADQGDVKCDEIAAVIDGLLERIEKATESGGLPHEPSVASAGSQPVAWGNEDDDGIYAVGPSEAHARYVLERAANGKYSHRNPRIVPLYRAPQPALTDEVLELIDAVEGVGDWSGTRVGDAIDALNRLK